MFTSNTRNSNPVIAPQVKNLHKLLLSHYIKTIYLLQEGVLQAWYRGCCCFNSSSAALIVLSFNQAPVWISFWSLILLRQIYRAYRYPVTICFFYLYLIGIGQINYIFQSLFRRYIDTLLSRMAVISANTSILLAGTLPTCTSSITVTMGVLS